MTFIFTKIGKLIISQGELLKNERNLSSLSVFVLIEVKALIILFLDGKLCQLRNHFHIKVAFLQTKYRLEFLHVN